MDSYVDQFQAAGGSLVMLAKGNRSKEVTAACKKYGGFYLGLSNHFLLIRKISFKMIIKQGQNILK
jgi:tartrate dehydratase beta subunit/fumarate hydratase class I family protein